MKCIGLMSAFVAVALLATSLPFLPGPYDALAVQLSAIARGLGVASLLLMPIGIVWLIYEWRQAGYGVPPGRVRFVFATLGAVSIAALFSIVVAIALSSPALTVGMVTAWGLVLWRGGPRLLNWARRARGRDFTAALAIILVPGVVAGAQFAMARSLTSFAWNQTMDGMAVLIADIEQYRDANGYYPRSLFSEWMDYRPAVMGVNGYQYEPSGDVYSLAVEVPSFSFDSRVFLVYNPADTHVMASHDADLLRRTADELVLYRGYHTARPLDRPHWKALYFD